MMHRVLTLLSLHVQYAVINFVFFFSNFPFQISWDWFQPSCDGALFQLREFFLSTLSCCSGQDDSIEVQIPGCFLSETYFYVSELYEVLMIWTELDYNWAELDRI